MVQLSERPGTARITNLQEKFIYEVGAIYDAENRFWEAQQTMLQCCQNNQLRSLIETHIQETEQQIHNLEQVFRALGKQPLRVTCDAAAGLVSDGQKLMLLAAENPQILNLGLVLPLAKCIFIHRRISFYTSSCTSGSASNRSIRETLPRFSKQRKTILT